jgi:hypothetical protein
MSLWKENLYMPVYWETPAVFSITATGHWNGSSCEFLRDDTGGSTTMWFSFNVYESVYRVAVQAKLNSNYHSVGVQIGQSCP